MRARYLLALVGLAVGTAQAATCAAGSGWTVVAGLGSCVTCLAGSYSTGGDSSSAAGNCQPCPANTYGGLAGATSCTPCAADSDTRSLTGVLACTACPRGLSNFGRRDACAACPSGSQFYAPNIIDGTLGALVDLLVKSDTLPNSCRFCPAGAAATSGANCVLCAAGSYAAGVGSGGCTAAPRGSYVAASGALVALPCPYGTYQTQTGQSGCTACPTNSGTTSTGASASSSCTSRQTGSILSNGQLIACPAGQTSDAAGANCVSCTGNTISSAAGACTACASGTGTLDHLTCTTIPAGSIIQNGIQTLCAAGTTSNADRTACVACTGNTIAATAGSGSCTACPTGKYTSDQINCAPILAGFIFANGKLSACPAGTTSNADNTLCNGCTGNTISALAGTATCSSCPALQYTLDNIACLPIPTGSIFSRGKLEVCPAGSVPDATAAICNACKGRTFALAGSGSCTACPAQQVTSNNIVCNAIPLGSILQGDVVVACGAGTTSDLTQTSCITCTGMQIAPVPGSLCSACPVGQATNNHITCYDIPAGYIIKLDALVSCNAGFTSDPTHATCTECVGLTISSVGSSCQSCGAHEYTADHQTCKPVERGYRIRQVDANEDGDNDPDSNVSTYSVYEACPAGTSSDGQSDCTACTGNTIAPSAGSQCEPCPGTQETTDHITCQAVASGGAQRRRSAMFKRSEQFLCPQGKTACYKYMSKKSPGRRFECIDTQSDVMACGGCREGYEDGLGEARGVDCTVFDDVAEASCVAGMCRYKCPHGWTLTEDKGCVWTVEGAKKRRPSGRASRSVPRPTPQLRLAIKVTSPSDK